MPLTLDVPHVLLGREDGSKETLIRAIGDLMVSLGEVTPRYVEGMLRREEQFSTWVTEGVALPHGTNEVKNEILRNSVVVAQAPKGLEWGNGRTVYLVIGLAGQGDTEHLKLLASLARILQNRNLVERLMKTSDPCEVVAILAAAEAEP